MDFCHFVEFKHQNRGLDKKSQKQFKSLILGRIVDVTRIEGKKIANRKKGDWLIFCVNKKHSLTTSVG
ncbi:hypothetical protein AKJ17_11105 [Vibrio nereis]|uniref:Uncharacterized protein n=1 Tax=Vibrio nereis TaxID=693 RepID=A0A0M0HMT4_VIBNE|nr:hypothetical protein AKJ17_11105 [Vibrio nereis]